MTIKVDNDYGVVYINGDVISTIAGASAIECYGLVGMASKNATNGIVSLLKKGDNLSKGVVIKSEDDGIIIDLYVIVQFGTRISVVAQNIIEKVKYNVENQTGLKVKNVNLNIEGVRVQS
ncbi:MAG: Asp23/Gls24 family envelope stress response protein [Acidaminobacteraceae bacterium]